MSSYSLNIIVHASRIADWILFGFIVALSFACLFALFNVYCFLALLCLSLLCLPKAWFKREFEWRFSFFLSAGAFFTAFFIQRSTYIYIIGVIFPLILSALLFDNNRKWVFSRSIECADTLFLAVLLTIIALLAGSGVSQVHDHLIGVAAFFIMLFALKHVCTAMRRATLLKCLLKIGEIKNPADFIEQILIKSNVKNEEKDFIRFRFNEFLKYFEKGEYQQAYITLSTGTLELLNIWKMKTDKNPEGWTYSHGKIRGALVHSSPPPPKRKGKGISREEDKIKDVETKKEIIKIFAKNPFTPIKDLLEAAIKHCN